MGRRARGERMMEAVFTDVARGSFLSYWRDVPLASWQDVDVSEDAA
jgi:hypothetical protein